MAYQSRRELLRIGVLGVAALPLVSGLNAGAMSFDEDRREGVMHRDEALRQGWQRRLSTSVVAEATSAFVGVLNQSRSAAVEDYKVVAFAARTLTNHLAEIGYLADRERQIVANRGFDDMIDYDIDMLASKLREKMHDSGYDVAVSTLQDWMTVPRVRRQSALDAVKDKGLQAVLVQSAVALESSAHQAVQSQSMDVRSLDWLDDWCKGMQLLIDAVFLFAIMDAFGCELGVAPCCIIALAFGLYGASLQLAKDFIC